MDKLKVAIVGLGSRGGSMLRAFYSKQKDIEILYACDEYEDRAKDSADLIKEQMGTIASGRLITKKFLPILPLRRCLFIRRGKLIFKLLSTV